jgi:serine/threonine protein kinase
VPELSDVSAELTAQRLQHALAHYEVLRAVGRGSMGMVFEARQVGLGRRVAIKVLPPALALRERTVKRFLREAEAMGRLNHPGVVDIFEVRSEQGLHYFSMKFIEGPPLDRVLKVGPLPVAEVLSIGVDVAEALAHAHSRGVLHRDVKPSNLLRDGSRVVLTDFGLARPIDAEEAGSMTESGDMVGTPLYMSPEQIRGEGATIDGRSDVWGLGATLYELLTARPPFVGTNAQAILHSILTRDAARIARLRDDVPRDVEAVVLKCLEKDPARRYATADALAQDLRAARDGRAVSAQPPRVFDPALRWMRRNRLQAGVALLLAASTLVFFTVSQRSRRQLTQRTGELAESQEQASKAEEERQASDRQRLLMNARFEMAELRRQWDEAAGDGQRDEVGDRLMDLIAAFPVRDFPQIAEEALGLWAHWMMASRREAGAQLVLEMVEPQLVGLEPGQAHALRAAVLSGLERHAAALEQHRARARLDPADPMPCLDAARILRAMAGRSLAGPEESGRPQGPARTHLAQALALVDEGLRLALRVADRDVTVSLWIERARCLLTLRDTVSARDALARAGRMDPARAEVHAMLRACERLEARGRTTPVAVERAPAALATSAPEPEDQLPSPFLLTDLLPNAGAVKPGDLPRYSEQAARQLQSIFTGMQRMLRDAASPGDDSEAPEASPRPSQQP